LRPASAFPERWTDEQLAEAVRLHEQERMRWHDIARQMGDPTWRKRKTALQHAVSRRVYARRRQEQAPVPAPVVVKPTTADEHMEAQRESARVRAIVRELKRLTNLRNFQQEILASIRDDILTMPVPDRIPEAKVHGTWDEETAVLHLGDTHLGQKTPARVNGGWHQTPAVTRWQLRRLQQAVYRIWQIHNARTPWVNLKILGLGDLVEGAHMRASQHRQSTPVTHQARDMGMELAEFITFCLKFFQHVDWEGVPGNHGRVSMKAGNAGLDELDPGDSFDWLAGEIARLMLKDAIDAGRVSMLNHETAAAETEVMGHRVYFEHGASMRGGGGWGGIPFYGQTRMASSYRDLEGDFTLLSIGHFHRPFYIPTGYSGAIIGNGSLPPTTPFVYQNKHAATRPTQWLVSLHPKKGVVMIRPIELDIKRMPASVRATMTYETDEEWDDGEPA